MKCTDNGEEEFYAGFIADVNHGTLEGCINRGQISHRSGKSLMSNYVGGICGMNKYIVINCVNYGNVSSSGNFGGNLDNRSAAFIWVAWSEAAPPVPSPALLSAIATITVR